MALALKPHLQTIFNQLPLESERLTKTVSDVLERTSTVSTAENQKAQWELLIRDSVFSLAVSLSFYHIVVWSDNSDSQTRVQH